MIAKQIRVSGDVQGVSYRYFAKKEAEKLGLLGWAKNGHDGTVSVFVQGEESSVGSFINWAKNGSPMASVERVETVETEAGKELKGFEVR